MIKQMNNRFAIKDKMMVVYLVEVENLSQYF